MTHRLWTITGLNTSSIEQKADVGQRLTLTLTECVHKLRELSCALYFEEDFIVIVCHFDVEVLGFGSFLLVWGLILVSHFGL